MEKVKKTYKLKKRESKKVDEKSSAFQISLSIS